MNKSSKLVHTEKAGKSSDGENAAFDRGGLIGFWLESAKQGMLELANLGAPFPLLDGLGLEDRLMRQHEFDEQRRPADEDMAFFRKRLEKRIYVYEGDDDLVAIRND